MLAFLLGFVRYVVSMLVLWHRDDTLCTPVVVWVTGLLLKEAFALPLYFVVSVVRQLRHETEQFRLIVHDRVLFEVAWVAWVAFGVWSLYLCDDAHPKNMINPATPMFPMVCALVLTEILRSCFCVQFYMPVTEQAWEKLEEFSVPKWSGLENERMRRRREDHYDY